MKCRLQPFCLNGKYATDCRSPLVQQGFPYNLSVQTLDELMLTLNKVHVCTRPSKKITNIKEVKRYLSVARISRDGLLAVDRTNPFHPSTELNIVTRYVLDGLVTALHISLDHPTRHQMQHPVRIRVNRSSAFLCES
jgi:hypothetical protein